MALQQILKQVPFLSHLADEQLAELAQSGCRLALGPGEVVFHSGDLSDTMYLILAGQVRVYQAHMPGVEMELATLSAGGFFGELALIDSAPRSASIATLTACEFLVLDRPTFHAHLQRYGAEIMFSVMAALAARTRDTVERFFKEQLTQQALRAEMEIERHRALSQLVAGVAHEVNTPLGVANTAASVLRRELASPALRGLREDPACAEVVADLLEAVNLVERSVQRAHRLIQEFKRVSVSQITDAREALDLVEAVAEIVDLFKLSARKAQLRIELVDALSAETRRWVGYRGYLSQVLLNLLTNCERYAYPRGAGGAVRLTLHTSGDEQLPSFTIVVRDFGQGIPAEHLPRVFEPFFTTGRQLGGTGLGLAIVRSIVCGPLQGRAEIASTPGEGTEVRITFPRTIVEV